RRLRVARGRLREVLLRLQSVEVQDLALDQLGKLLLALVVTLPDAVEAVEDQYRSAGPQAELAGLDVDGRPGVLRRGPPARPGPPPDQLVDPVLVGGQVLADVLRPPGRIGRPDRLVGLLGAGPRLLLAGLAQVAVAEAVLDPLLDLALRLPGDAGGVRAHVGDEAGRPLRAELDALVQVLRQAHRPLRREAEA